MYYSGLYSCDTINGKGFRVALFVSGCNKKPKCKNCHNQKAWDFTYGNEFTEEAFNEILSYIKPNHIRGLSLLGGEVFDNLNENWLFDLAKEIKKIYRDKKDIWCWTGYEYDDLIQDERKKEFMSYLDVLIDGEFIPEQKDLSLYFRNSRNQRIINVQQSLKQNEVILYDV